MSRGEIFTSRHSAPQKINTVEVIVSHTGIHVLHLSINASPLVYPIHDVERLAEIDIELMIGQFEDVAGIL